MIVCPFTSPVTYFTLGGVPSIPTQSWPPNLAGSAQRYKHTAESPMPT
jgi:hypothetical protein